MNSAFALTNFRGPLIAEMVGRGAIVFALAPDFDERERARAVALGAVPVDFDLDRAGTNVWREVRHTVKLARLLKSLQVDTVLSCFIKPAIYGTLAARIAGAPRRFAMIEGLGYVFTHDGGTVSFRRRVLSQLVSILLRVGLRYARTVFFLNDDDRQLFVERRLVRPAAAARLNGTGIDLDHFRPAPPVTTPVTFILVARLLREKGVYEYAEAARRLSPEHPTARFLLVGGLDANPGAVPRETVEAWHAAGILEWRGHVDDVIAELASSSVFVLPSWREGAPRSTQEAMALARPVITTDAPGARDTVVEGQNGYLIPVRDAGALAEAMQRFLLNPSMIIEMGRASRALAEDRYDVREINAQILEVLDFQGDGATEFTAETYRE